MVPMTIWIGRFRDLGADQTRSVYHGVHAVLPGRVQQRGEIQNVSLDEGNVGSRQFSLEEFSVRLHVIEDQPAHLRRATWAKDVPTSPAPVISVVTDTPSNRVSCPVNSHDAVS